MVEAAILETAGLRGAEVREEMAGRAAAKTARRMVEVTSAVNVKVAVCSVGLLRIVALVLVMY